MWLVAQAAVGWATYNMSWPVTGWPMFRGTPTERAEYVLVGLPVEGPLAEVEPADVGLNYTQLASFLDDRVRGGGPRSAEALRKVATALEEAGGPELVKLRLVRVVQDLAGHETERSVVAEWSR